MQMTLFDSSNESLILKYLSDHPMHIDKLSQAAGISIVDTCAALTLLELRGMVRRAWGENYELTGVGQQEAQ